MFWNKKKSSNKNYVRVNGLIYEGRNLNIYNNGIIEIDGVVVDGNWRLEAPEIKIETEGQVNLEVRGNVKCGDIQGNLSASLDVEAGNVKGNLTVSGDVKCGDIGGNVEASGDVRCGKIGGNVSATGDVIGRGE